MIFLRLLRDRLLWVYKQLLLGLAAPELRTWLLLRVNLDGQSCRVRHRLIVGYARRYKALVHARGESAALHSALLLLRKIAAHRVEDGHVDFDVALSLSCVIRTLRDNKTFLSPWLGFLEDHLSCDFLDALVFLSGLRFEDGRPHGLKPRAYVAVFCLVARRPFHHAWLCIGSSVVHLEQLHLLCLQVLKNLQRD